jgi:hypothetical protein
MRTAYRIFYLIMIPLLILFSPILFILAWVYDLLKDYWWDKAKVWADETMEIRRRNET